MREIKLRGKSLTDNNWVYGSLINNCGSPFIVNGVIEANSEYIALENWMPVDSETVGQYTGLKDKNGVEIYERDIIKLHQFLFDGFSEVEKELTAEVVYQEDTCSFALNRMDNKNIKGYMGFEDDEEVGPLPIFLFHGIHEESFTVIGNIYENPELLEVES